jgi:hypothetical protein
MSAAPDDPLIRVYRMARSTKASRWIALVLAVLALLALGLWIGRKVPTSSAAPQVEQGTVTWVNTGAIGGGGAEFLVRLDGSTEAVGVQLPNNTVWTVGTSLSGWNIGSLPPCLAKPRGRGSRDGVGSVHARIRFGVIHATIPNFDGAEDIVVWVDCL